MASQKTSINQCPRCGSFSTQENIYDYTCVCFICNNTWNTLGQRQAGTQTFYEWANDNGYGHNESTYDDWMREQRQKRAYSQGGQHGYHNSSGFHYEEEKMGVPLVSLVLSKDLLRRLIMLCHPDKHGGSEMANEVTKELLAMKEKLK